MHVICFSWIGVAVGEVGVDWGLAKVRRPRLRHSNIVLNQNEADDGREPPWMQGAAGWLAIVYT